MPKFTTNPEATKKADILAAAMALARRKGFAAVSREQVSAECNIAAGTVSYHWGEIRKLQSAVVRRAIDDGDVEVLAGALRAGNAVAKTAPEALKARAARLICG